MTRDRDYSSILFTPEEVGTLGAAYLQERKDNKAHGVKLGLACLDNPDAAGNFLLPLHPTELMSIIARPGNGKTGFMVRWARERAAILRKAKIENRVVCYVTLEQSIEELNAFNVAADEHMSITKMAMGEITDEEWTRCLKSAINRRFMPLWNIGYSSMTAKKQVRIDVDAIAGALEIMRSQGSVIDVVFVDYLQRMPDNNAESKTVAVSKNLDGLKDIALRLRCPVVAGVQARREVDDRKGDPVPELDDRQWTSNIEQTSDRVLSLVRPRKYREEGEVFGKTKVEGHCQMLVTVLKQKLAPDNFSKWVYFDPVYNKLDELEMAAQAQRPGAR